MYYLITIVRKSIKKLLGQLTTSQQTAFHVLSCRLLAASMTFFDKFDAARPQILDLNGLIALSALTILSFAATALFGWLRKIRIWQRYCSSHSKFSLEAGQGHHLWLEDPFSRMCEAAAACQELCRYCVLTLETRSSKLLALQPCSDQICLQPRRHVSEDDFRFRSLGWILTTITVPRQITAPVSTGSTMPAGKFQRWILNTGQL